MYNAHLCTLEWHYSTIGRGKMYLMLGSWNHLDQYAKHTQKVA